MFDESINRGPKFIMLMMPILISVLFCYGCRGKTIFEKPGGFLTGTVTDSISGFPLNEAWINNDSLQDSTATITDSLGHYIQYIFSPGLHRFVFCGKEGYLIQKREYSITSYDTTILNFKLVLMQ